MFHNVTSESQTTNDFNYKTYGNYEELVSNFEDARLEMEEEYADAKAYQIELPKFVAVLDR